MNGIDKSVLPSSHTLTFFLNPMAYGATFMSTWSLLAPRLSALTKWPALWSLSTDRWPTCPKKINFAFIVSERQLSLSGQSPLRDCIPYGVSCKPNHGEWREIKHLRTSINSFFFFNHCACWRGNAYHDKKLCVRHIYIIVYITLLLNNCTGRKTCKKTAWFDMAVLCYLWVYPTTAHSSWHQSS